MRGVLTGPPEKPLGSCLTRVGTAPPHVEEAVEQVDEVQSPRPRGVTARPTVCIPVSAFRWAVSVPTEPPHF